MENISRPAYAALAKDGSTDDPQVLADLRDVDPFLADQLEIMRSNERFGHPPKG